MPSGRGCARSGCPSGWSPWTARYSPPAAGPRRERRDRGGLLVSHPGHRPGVARADDADHRPGRRGPAAAPPWPGPVASPGQPNVLLRRWPPRPRPSPAAPASPSSGTGEPMTASLLCTGLLDAPAPWLADHLTAFGPLPSADAVEVAT